MSGIFDSLRAMLDGDSDEFDLDKARSLLVVAEIRYDHALAAIDALVDANARLRNELYELKQAKAK